MRRSYRWGFALLTPLVLLLLIVALLQANATHAVSGPAPGTVVNTATYRYFNTQVITNRTTIYSPVPLAVGNADASVVDVWHSADVFVTSNLGASAALTVTPQLSADCSNFADTWYDVAFSTTVGVRPYQIVATSTGTQYMPVPMAGRCLRFAIGSTGTVTVSVWATLRNN